MKIAKLIKKQSAFMLAAVLLVLAAMPKTAYGAIGIDVDKKGTITFDLPASETATGEEGTNGEQYYKELQDYDIKVNLYKVADVDVSGRYTPLEAYKAGKLDLSSVSASTSAAQWQELAQEAKQITDTSEISTPWKVTIAKGESKATSGELDTGMYLADAQEIVTDEYIYRFTPFLVAMPGNNYYEDRDDEWIYNVTVGLKPDRQERYGDVAFEKEFRIYNETLGVATAIFQVEARKGEDVIYSDMVSINFSSEKTSDGRVITRLPVGTVVTIREVYSGASYINAGSPREYTVTVEDANPKYDTPDGTGVGNDKPGVLPINEYQGEIDSVLFINNYNGQTNGGSSVVNHFTYKTNEAETQDAASAGGTWDVEQIFSDGRGGAE